MVMLIKRIYFMQEFEDAVEGHAILKVGPCEPESVS